MTQRTQCTHGPHLLRPVSSLFQVIAMFPKHHLRRAYLTRPLARTRAPLKEPFLLPSRGSQARAGTQTDQDTNPPPAPTPTSLPDGPERGSLFLHRQCAVQEGACPSPTAGGGFESKSVLSTASVPGSRADAHGGGVLFIGHALLVTENLRASSWDLTMTVIVQRRGLGL